VKIKPPRRRAQDGLVMEALLVALRTLTPLAGRLCLGLLALALVSGIRFIGPGESALVLRLGRLQPEVHGPGLLLAWPAPIDEIVRVPTGAELSLPLERWTANGQRVVRVNELKQLSDAEIEAYLKQNPTGGHGVMPLPEYVTDAGNYLDPTRDGYTLTGDWNIVQGRFTLRYRIVDPVAWWRAGAAVEPTLAALCQQATATELSQRAVDRSLTADRDAIALGVRDRVRQRVRVLGLGVEPVAFDLRELVPPRQVVAAFEEVTDARLMVQTLASNARQYRTTQLTAASGQAAVIQQRVFAYATQLTATAQGEAAAFARYLVEYQRSPTLVRDRVFAEALGELIPRANAITLLPTGGQVPGFFLEPSSDGPR
jgi:modulator of FtsH protease HflK